MWLCCQFSSSTFFVKAASPFDFLKHNFKKAAIKSNLLFKLMEVWSCFFLEITKQGFFTVPHPDVFWAYRFHEIKDCII